MAERIESLVVDASAVVELVARTSLRTAVAARIRGAELHAPALLDAEVLSAIGRLNRAGDLSGAVARRALQSLVASTVTRHPLAPLVEGAWSRRSSLRLSDAFYVELATSMGVPLVTTDLKLARAAEIAEPIG